MLTMWRVTSVFLVALVSLGNGATQSQPPPQTPPIKTEIKPNGAIQNQQNTKPKEGGLPTPPPSIHVAIPDSSDTSKYSQHGREDGTEFWSLSGYRFKITDSLLVLFTFILAIFTGLLWCSTKKLWIEAKTASDIAKSSVDLARQDFLSTHRPKIILRDAFCNDNELDHQIVVTYTLVNIGETRARIVLWGAEVQLHTPQTVDPYRLPSASDPWSGDSCGRQIIEPGEECRTQQYTTRYWRISDKSRHAFDEVLYGVFFCGHLIYEDDRNVRRHMAFWRKYDMDTSRFHIVSHPTLKALEYAD